MYAKQLHCRYKPLWQWSGGGWSEWLDVCHTPLALWTADYRWRSLFALFTPPPHLPRYSPLPTTPHPLPPCTRQQSETTTLGSLRTWDARGLSHSPLRGPQHLGTHRLGGGGGGGYLTVHTEDNTWELIDLGYVGFIPQSTQRTMALGSSVTWDMWGLSHSPHRGQWHLGTPGLRMWGVDRGQKTTTLGNSRTLHLGFCPTVHWRRPTTLGHCRTWDVFILQFTTRQKHWGTLGLWIGSFIPQSREDDNTWELGDFGSGVNTRVDNFWKV